MLLYSLAKFEPTMPRLEWSETPESRETFPLAALEVVIGRRSDAHIVLAHPLVSRQHARIIREDNSEGRQFVIVDLQSRHGTWVNGERIDRRALRSNDRIRLGAHGIELSYLDELESPPSAVTSLFEGDGIQRSMRRLATVMPEESTGHSELEKISCLLDFHYYFGKEFSAEKTFQHILRSALTISGAERGFIMRKEQGEFAFAVGLDGAGNSLGAADFRTSGSVVERAARGEV